LCHSSPFARKLQITKRESSNLCGELFPATTNCLAGNLEERQKHFTLPLQMALIYYPKLDIFDITCWALDWTHTVISPLIFRGTAYGTFNFQFPHEFKIQTLILILRFQISLSRARSICFPREK
jgi:hypothetical protein